jgi:inorganic triphosphatase YgiF
MQKAGQPRMAASKKWEIPEIEQVHGLKAGAHLILSHRLYTVIQLAGAFRRSNDVEDLHQLRIAIRRLRYPLETYLSLFKRKLSLKFIAELNTLQDAAGHARDMDIMIARLERDRDAHGWRIAKRVFSDLRAERVVLYRLATDAIDLFLVSPLLYDFKTEICYFEHVEEIEDSAASEPEPMPASDTQHVPHSEGATS